ncbi:MAG TPA: prepilin-type N-terminal cleavage/methylation domain-containing protein, partial [Pirellulales bacterium]|nr:prepilin-type N-terminal cleavage/methylation domain-containing protein [Pirellulales bacterium]
MAMKLRRAHFPGRAPRRGFSLAEVVVGAAVLSMFLLATPWAIRMATRAVPDGTSIPSASMYAGRAMELIASDIGFATSIVSNSATSIAFTLPSRDGDGQNETIQYSWSGIPDDPLLRQYNGGNASAVINGVQEFQLAYDKRAVTAPATYSPSA